jgi:hypothetical protein
MTNSLNSVSLVVGVYDNSGTTVESSRGPYTVALNLSPTGTISGTSSGSTSSGQITFSSIRITSAGTFSIVATSSTITQAQTSTVTIKNYVYTITLTGPVSNPSVNFDFSITATLKGEDTNTFLRSCVLTLSEVANNLGGTLTQAITTGSYTFTVYLKTVGTFNIIGTCPAEDSSPAVTGTVSVTSLILILRFDPTITPVIKK